MVAPQPPLESTPIATLNAILACSLPQSLLPTSKLSGLLALRPPQGSFPAAALSTDFASEFSHTLTQHCLELQPPLDLSPNSHLSFDLALSIHCISPYMLIA